MPITMDDTTQSIEDITRTNAPRYLAHSPGGFKVFAQIVGLSDTYVNQLIDRNPRRGIGRKRQFGLSDAKGND